MRLAIIALLLLAGCSSEVKEAERQYDIVARGRDNQAKCEAAKKVADAYLRNGTEADYRLYKLRAETDCMSASFEPYNVEGIEPDNLEALDDNMTATG